MTHTQFGKEVELLASKEGLYIAEAAEDCIKEIIDGIDK